MAHCSQLGIRLVVLPAAWHQTCQPPHHHAVGCIQAGNTVMECGGCGAHALSEDVLRVLCWLILQGFVALLGLLCPTPQKS